MLWVLKGLKELKVPKELRVHKVLILVHKGQQELKVLRVLKVLNRQPQELKVLQVHKVVKVHKAHKVGHKEPTVLKVM